MHRQQETTPTPYFLYHRIALAWLLLLGLLSTQLACNTKACYYCGSYFEMGETFRSFDLCNTCTCTEDRSTGIGRVVCSTANQCKGYCYWEGKKYSSRDTLLLRGSCARCNCTPTYVRRLPQCGGLNFCLGLQWCGP